MINKKSISLGQLALASVLMLSACSDPDITINQEDVKGIEMVGIRPALTRAGEVAELKDYVGRSEFDDKDRAVFCTIKRTEQAINQFTYKDIEFICAATTSEQGITSIGWSRDKTKGTTAQGGTESAPDRIYWSDAVNPHTFIGFCKPQQGEGNPEFDWGLSGQSYYGSIGDPTITHIPSEEDSETLLPAVIDFRSTFDVENHEIRSGNDELRKNDILLTYSKEIKADDAIALLKFYHGLAQVRVIVNISDFAASGKDDTKSIVSDMILKDMLTMYKWSQTNVATVKLVQSDQTALDELYATTTKPTYNQQKDFKLWIPEPSGVGKDASKTFTFYGLAVPTTIPAAGEGQLAFSFKVTYPNPMKPTEMKEHIYNASIGGIKFDAGRCTTINISLNHKNEKMTIGAQYDDWEFENTPDQGELKKNSTFMASTARVWNTGGFNEDITIIGDAKATVDDATWLYVDQKTKKIVDVYGNDGSVGKPFQISTAEQLLSFAYEVKGDNRVSTLYKDLGGAEKTLSGSFDFTGYNVTLDAGLTLQPTEKKTKEELLLKKVSTESDEYKAATSAQSWIGIGDTGKPFNGTFNGGVRLISRLYGSPFFAELGPQAHIDQLILEDVIGVEGDGGFTNVNRGIICACKVDGDVKSHTEHDPVGSFVGTNYGLIFACYHIGDLTAEGAEVVGGLVGCNKEGGQIVASYNAGKITANKTWKNGVLGKNEVTAGDPTALAPSIFGCFYDTTKATGVSNVAKSDENATSSDFPSYGKTTVELMKASFVGAPSDTYVLTGENPEPTLTLNGLINSWVEANKDALNAKQVGLADHLKARYYVSQPAGYPWVY